MNFEEYIGSGILELYAMNALSEKETIEVELNIEKYPQLRAELEEIRRGLEAYTLSLSKSPREGLKEKIFSAIEQTTVADETISNEGRKTEEAKVIQMGPDRRVPWLAAASILFLITTAVLFFQNRNYKQTIADLSGRLENTEKQFADLNVEYTSNKEVLAELEKPETMKILLASKIGKPDENAVLFLNQKTMRSIIYMEQLASLPETNQYQLWAIVAGKPVDMGVLSKDSVYQIVKGMPQLLTAQAFAITIEKKGGSATPTLEQMVAYGAI